MTAPVIPLENAPDIVKSDRLDLLTGGTFSDSATWVWQEVWGLKSLSAPNAYTTQDTSTFNTGLLGSDMPTQFKKTITGTLQKYVADNLTHQRLKEAGEPGTEGTFTLVMVRLYNRHGEGDGRRGIGFVQWEPQGGEGTAVKTNNFTILMQTWETISNPVADTPAAAVLTSALPGSQGENEWVEVIGTGFDATISDVTVGGTTVGVAANRLLISSTKLHIKLPAGAAGSAPIVVKKTGAADSNALAYTRT